MKIKKLVALLMAIIMIAGICVNNASAATVIMDNDALEGSHG